MQNRLKPVQILHHAFNLCHQGTELAVMGLWLNLSWHSTYCKKIAYLSDNPELQSWNSIGEFHFEICWITLSRLRAIETKINLHLVPSCVWDTRWSHRLLNLMLTRHKGSSEIRPKLKIFCRRGCFLCISISRSLSCLRILYHMNVERCLDMRRSTHYFLVNLSCWSPSIFFLSFPSVSWRWLVPSTLSECLTINDCGNLWSSFPINSRCSSAYWLVEPIRQGSTHQQFG